MLHRRWSELADDLRRVQPPKRPPSGPPRAGSKVPPRLRHLFWNVSPSQMDARRAGPFIARRLLRAQDPEGLAWGATHLTPSDWREGAGARGLDKSVRAMAENLAAHSNEASPQTQLEKPTVVAGLRVAGLKDLLAMKLKVLGERGEMRDYFDVKAIDEQSPLSVEDGIALYLKRYRLDPAGGAVQALVRAMGYLDDVEEDEALPTTKEELAGWWRKRQTAVIENLSRAEKT